jgi:hypothetical protein
MWERREPRFPQRMRHDDFRNQVITSDAPQQDGD